MSDSLSDKPMPSLSDWLRENAPDCGDNSCMFGGRGKGGMRTNGGCRCYRDLPTMKRIYVERMFAALATQSSTAAMGPQESPLAWIVFTPRDLQGCDYYVFADQQQAENRAACDDADEEVIPLYRPSAFPSARKSPLLEACLVWQREKDHQDGIDNVDDALYKAIVAAADGRTVSLIDPIDADIDVDRTGE
jgi:hypothetical protein